MAVAYPDELLVEGEQVVMHRHPHWKMIVVPVLVLLLVVGLVSYLAALIGAQAGGCGRGSCWLVVGAGAGHLVHAWCPVIRWRTTHFVVTNRRVLVREGVVTRQRHGHPDGPDQQRAVPAQRRSSGSSAAAR